jgi:hypothetical protein
MRWRLKSTANENNGEGDAVLVLGRSQIYMPPSSDREARDKRVTDVEALELQLESN